jgi:predicted lysophospholipase L1 biosynthesis ABC-type transport system permease subunit
MVAIAAATAGVVAVVAFGASLSHLVDTPSLYGWTFDAVGIPTDRSDAVRADPGVASVAEVRAQLSLQIGGDPVNGYAIKPLEGDVDAPIVRGRAPQSLDEVALGADTMSHAGVGIGDRVSIGGQNAEQKMRVVGQAVFLTDQDAYPLADGALVSFDAAERLGSPDTFDTLGITFASGDHHATEQRLSKLAPDDFARPRPPAEVEKLEQVRRLPEFLAAFMVLLGVVAVAHAMVVSVRRNRRDLGVLRALGFRRRDVALTVTWQAIAIAVVGVVVGVPTGVFIGRALWHAIANGIGIRAVADVPLIALALVLPATVAVAVVAALLPAWKAARMHPTELLRSE